MVEERACRARRRRLVWRVRWMREARRRYVSTTMSSWLGVVSGDEKMMGEGDVPGCFLVEGEVHCCAFCAGLGDKGPAAVVALVSDLRFRGVGSAVADVSELGDLGGEPFHACVE